MEQVQKGKVEEQVEEEVLVKIKCLALNIKENRESYVMLQKNGRIGKRLKELRRGRRRNEI